MLNIEKWRYNEMRQIGTDYDNETEVAAYDERMSRFRDFGDEARRIIKAIGLKRDHIVLEIGAGTGEIALEVSRYCQRVIAIDISQSMLDYARKKAHRRDIANITFMQAGFLTYEHTGNPLDAAYTQIALHHLPDFWKMIALKRINDMLREGGRFYLHDVIFSFRLERYAESINSYITVMKGGAGRETADNICLHIKDEYSTFDWILEEMLRRTGFSIDSVDHLDEFIASYTCTKKKGNTSG
jgi:putative AdoMet-dependent methyltransferase